MENSEKAIPKSGRDCLLVAKHRSFVKQLHGADKHTTLDYWMSEHLRISGAYWALGTLDMFDCVNEDMSNLDELMDWVVQCQDRDGSGGFAGNVDHEPHLLYTLSAVQVALILNALDRIDTEGVVSFVSRLQLADGSFCGDQWGEVDTRFSYCALSCLSLLGALDRIDVDAAVNFIGKCCNFDGAFGCVPDAESHAGQTFCCVGALAVVGRLDDVVKDRDALAWWLTERQVKSNGGFNGRPEKLSDVCYSWWVLSALAALDRLEWFDRDALQGFILRCQDDETGGIADREGDTPDVYHLFFGVAGLSLMDHPGLVKIDPVYALTHRALRRSKAPICE